VEEKVEITEEHQDWLGRATEMARVKRYDEAREFALRVLREDGSNPKALWIIASTTSSLAERRNVLRTLVRVQPENLKAQQILNSVERELRVATSSRSSAVAETMKPTFQPMLLYAVAIAAVLIIAAALIAAL
jgi:hypothetical protein